MVTQYQMASFYVPLEFTKFLYEHIFIRRIFSEIIACDIFNAPPSCICIYKYLDYLDRNFYIILEILLYWL